MNKLYTGIVFVCTAVACVSAQESGPVTQAVQNTPVTKVIALGHLTASPSGQPFSATMRQEVGDTVRLYLAGKIDQWYVRKDQNGVVFVLNATSAEQAQSLLADLPLVKAHLMEFDFVPVGPLSPLALLTREVPQATAAPVK